MDNKNSGVAWALTIFSIIGIIYLLAMTYCGDAMAYEGLADKIPEYTFTKVEC